MGTKAAHATAAIMNMTALISVTIIVTVLMIICRIMTTLVNYDNKYPTYFIENISKGKWFVDALTKIQ